jgi:flagellar hook-associated protein 2
MDFLISPIISAYWPPNTSRGTANSLNSYLKVNFSSSPDVANQLDALNGLYARAYQMLSQADQLSGEEGKANFSQRPTSSTDRDVADISYFDKTHYLARTPESRFFFQVQQIAWNQVNHGVPLFPNDGSVINTGTNTFALNVGGTGYPLTVIISSGATNAEALEKIAQAIDAAGAGVTTQIVRENGAIHLDLYGQTGEDQAFSLADTSGNAVSASGINNSIQTAQDAKFLMNGTAYIQPDNAVSLMDGHLQVNLTGTGTAAVTTGPQTAVDLVQSLTETMNSFGSYVRDNPYLISDLSSAWSDLVDQEAGILSKYGLEAGSRGQVGLDTLKFTTELQKGAAAAAEAVSGLAYRVKNFVKGLTSYPAATLLASPPTSGSGAAYFRSTASAPWYNSGTGGFWRIA